MYIQNKRAFTMIELTFVIVVIGILAAIALPRFSDTADAAYISNAESTLASVRSSLATERQKRVLRGDTGAITNLSLTENGTDNASTNVFDHFSADADDNYHSVLNYPIKACSGSNAKACWKRAGSEPYNYIYVFVDGTTEAWFKLDKNKLKCDNDAADCAKIGG